MNVYATPEYRALESRYDCEIPREEIELIRAKYHQPSELDRAEAMARQAFDDVAAAKERMNAAETLAVRENALDDLACAEIELRHWTARVALLRAGREARNEFMAIARKMAADPEAREAFARALGCSDEALDRMRRTGE